MTNHLPAALREALEAQGAFADWLVDNRLGVAIQKDRARAMAAALRWAYGLDFDDPLALQSLVNAIAALEQEAAP